MFTSSAFGRDKAALGILLAFLLAGGAEAAPEAAEGTVRQSTSKHYGEGGRDAPAPSTVTRDRYGVLVTEGARSKPGVAQANSGKLSGEATGEVMESATHDFWIFFTDVILFGDDDRDGFHYGIDLLFDADTIYEAADVYAVLYLSLEGGPWNEYAVTDDFTIFGATSEDEFVVVTELDSGFPRGSYDILIELYDAFDGTFLTSLGPADTSELALLPLEDFQRDDPRDHHHHHGGGAAGLPLLALLSLFALSRLRRSYSAGSETVPRAVRMTLRPQAERESK